MTHTESIYLETLSFSKRYFFGYFVTFQTLHVGLFTNHLAELMLFGEKRKVRLL